MVGRYPAICLIRHRPRTWNSTSPNEEASFQTHSTGLTGGVCKERGHIHRSMLNYGY